MHIYYGHSPPSFFVERCVLHFRVDYVGYNTFSVNFRTTMYNHPGLHKRGYTLGLFLLFFIVVPLFLLVRAEFCSRRVRSSLSLVNSFSATYLEYFAFTRKFVNVSPRGDSNPRPSRLAVSQDTAI